MQVKRGLFQIAMTEQQLDCSQIGTRLEQMSREAVPKRVRMDLISKPRPCRSLAASSPDYLCDNRLVAGVPAVAWRSPDFWFLSKSAHISLQLLQQDRAQHDIAIFTALSTFNVV